MIPHAVITNAVIANAVIAMLGSGFGDARFARIVVGMGERRGDRQEDAGKQTAEYACGENGRRAQCHGRTHDVQFKQPSHGRPHHSFWPSVL